MTLTLSPFFSLSLLLLFLLSLLAPLALSLSLPLHDPLSPFSPSLSSPAAAPSQRQRPPPAVPRVGAVQSGKYRNMFVEAGYDEQEVKTRLQSIVQQLFFGHTSNEAVVFPATDGSNSSYILDVGDNDVRTEGMGYGLVAAVQLDMQVLFDRLFRWYKTFMQHNKDPSDPRYGYSSWHCSSSGQSMDSNPASDGETFIVSGLLLAAKRWGDRSVGVDVVGDRETHHHHHHEHQHEHQHNTNTISTSDQGFNYTAEADLILHAMLHKEDPPCGVQGCQSVVNMFGGFVSGDHTPPMVVFVPYASAAAFTDPSYHTPFFYEQWALHDKSTAAYWRTVANTSRAFFHAAAHPKTALTPNYAEFTGAPQSGAPLFSYDAWRTIRNVAVDYAWYAADPGQITLCNTLLSFFRNLPSWPNYGNQFTLDGHQQDGDHSPGLVAMNAVATLASDEAYAWDFIDALWNTTTPSGQWRYYDGMLYLEAWLHLSGNYRAAFV